MAELVIVTGETSSGKSRWAEQRDRAHGWKATPDFGQALELLQSGINVVLDNDLLVGHDVTIKHIKAEKQYKPFSKEEEK